MNKPVLLGDTTDQITLQQILHARNFHVHLHSCSTVVFLSIVIFCFLSSLHRKESKLPSVFSSPGDRLLRMGDDGQEESPDKLVAEGVIMHVFFSNNSAASSNSLISALPHKNDLVSLDWQT